MSRAHSTMTFHHTASPAPALSVPLTSAPLVSFVLVTYGTPSSMIDESLARLTSSFVAESIDAEIIVVDNAHPVMGHAAGHHLALTTTGLRLALPDRNLGFGGGNELGIGAARASTLCVMNPDLMVHDGWLGPMLELLAAHPGDVVAPRLVDAAGNLDEAGQLVGPDGHTAPASIAATHIDYASAACWLLDAATHELVGGFDPRFHPAYFEDVDYALRLRRLGRRFRPHPFVELTHLRGGSILATERTTDITPQWKAFTDLWSSDLWLQPPLPAS